MWIELYFEILVGMAVLILIVSIITAIIAKINFKEINNIQNIFVGKLANNDSSIENITKHLKLINSINTDWR